jgi:Rhodopirellula transposase DDE domain
MTDFPTPRGPTMIKDRFGAVKRAHEPRDVGIGADSNELVQIVDRHSSQQQSLEGLIDAVTRGDPESPLRWTSKSAAKLAEALRGMGHQVVDRTVLRLLKAKG